MVDEKDKNISVNDLNSENNVFVTDENEYNELSWLFDKPTAIHYYSIIYKSAEIHGYKWDNKLRTFKKP